MRSLFDPPTPPHVSETGERDAHVELFRFFAHDANALLHSLSEHLRLISTADLPPHALAHIHAAIRKAAGVGRMIVATLDEAKALPESTSATVGTSLEELHRDLQIVTAARLRASGIGYELRFDPGLPKQAMIDRVKIDRILFNLINNAAQHGSGGALRGTVRVTVAAPAPQVMRMTVQDQGPGFAPADLAILQSGGRLGQGLGLAIVAALVTSVEGACRFGNLAAGGAFVEIDLPCVALNEDEIAFPVQTGRLAGRRILVADDNRTGRLLVSGILSQEGAMVELARDGAEASHLVAERDFDLLVVEANVSRVSAAELIAKLRKRSGARGSMPTLALTADSSMALLHALIAAGADRVLTKPLPAPVEILRIVERLMLRAVPAEGGPGSTFLPSPGTATVSGIAPQFDPAPLIRLCEMAGPETAREIIERLKIDLFDTQRRIDLAGDDIHEMRAASHVMIALAGTAGARGLLAQAQRISRMVNDGQKEGLAAILWDLRFLTDDALRSIDLLPLAETTGSN